MRRALWVLLWIGLLGCAETVRCPDAQVFDEGGECVAIPDAGPPTDGG